MGTELILVKTNTTMETDLIIMTKRDNEVVMDLNTSEVINGHLLQGITERVKLLVPDLIEEITKVTVILLQEIPISLLILLDSQHKVQDTTQALEI